MSQLQDMKSSEKSVLIGIPCASGYMPTTMVQSLLQLHKPVPCGIFIVERQRVERARNIIVAEFLRSGTSHLFFVDDDNPIPVDTLEKLLADNKDIVTTPILTRNPDATGKHTMCSYYVRHIDAQGQGVRLYDPIVDFKEDGYLHEVDCTGMGCVLIKRRVLEVLAEKYDGDVFQMDDLSFPETIIDGKKYKRRTMGEDVTFCERAIDEGFEIWLDDRIRPFHIMQSGMNQWKGNN